MGGRGKERRPGRKGVFWGGVECVGGDVWLGGGSVGLFREEEGRGRGGGGILFVVGRGDMDFGGGRGENYV